MATWDQLLLNYESDRRRVIQASKPKRITHEQKLKEGRDFDLMTAKYRDPEIETKKSQEEARRVLEMSHKGHLSRLESETEYDIVTFKSKVDGTMPQQAVAELPIQTEDSPLRFHRVSGARLPVGSVIDSHQRSVSQSSPRVEHRSRQADVHSAPYRLDVPPPLAVDRDAIIQRAKEARQFDPILVKFADPDKDREYGDQYRRTCEDIAIRKESSLPPSLRNAEGRQYDIIKTKGDEDVDQSLRTTLRETVETRMKEEGTTEHEREEQRKLGRISHRRYELDTLHGYNIVSTLPHRGRKSHPPPPARTAAQVDPLRATLSQTKTSKPLQPQRPAVRTEAHVPRDPFGRILR